ncbi:hypothetical protein, partial [Klebsiella pneumoniae]|uniref:hypothetical protein n=1 Tax=Klebsiella pneumoniae TaxID=573 RepID=UPI0025A2EA26
RTDLHIVRVVPVDSGPLADTGLIIVTLSNNKSDLLRPCRTDDGRHCYWDASQRGNGVGDDFITTRGHTWRMADYLQHHA